MVDAASIRVLATDFGFYPEILPLHSRIRPDSPLVKVSLDIDWTSPDFRDVLAAMQRHLLEVSPSFLQHRCGGPEGYHIHGMLDDDAPARAESEIEAGLALAHLIEHIMIDAVAYVASETRVSGVTGAHRDCTRRFDVFVECPDRAIGSVAVTLALCWADLLARGESPDGQGRIALALARHLYLTRPAAINLVDAARSVPGSVSQLREAFDWLERSRFACPQKYAMNFSGIPFYQMCAAGN